MMIIGCSAPRRAVVSSRSHTAGRSMGSRAARAAVGKLLPPIASRRALSAPLSPLLQADGLLPLPSGPHPLMGRLWLGEWCRVTPSLATSAAQRGAVRTFAAAPATDEARQATDAYGAGQIQVLEGLEPVRKRPGMYIGSTGQRGLHHLVWEIVDNAIDEVQGGHARDIRVQVDLETGWVEVSDDGRGVPTDIHPSTGKSSLETVLTVLHAGGKFGGDSSGYSVSGGLHGVGLSVVNALSEELEVCVWRNGQTSTQAFRRGVAEGPMVQEVQQGSGDKTGTQVRFLYDRTIFSSSAQFDIETIRSRLRELAFLNSNARIHLRFLGRPAKKEQGTLHSSETNFEEESGAGSSNGAPSEPGAAAEPEWEVLEFAGGLKQYVQWVNRDKKIMHPPIYAMRTIDNVVVEMALQWSNDSYSDNLLGFVNSIKTTDGGTHMDGLKASLTRTVNTMARKNKTLKDTDPNLSGEHVREGLGAIVSVKVGNPEFEGQTKTRLGNPEVRKIVERVVGEDIAEALTYDSQLLNGILSKAMQAYKAAEAAKKARELVRRKSVLTKSTLPGKLSDCSAGFAESEIFIVEGDSAGGSAKQARNRQFQAILPLRGKILNVERKDDAALYKNQEISNLITALGLGLKGEEITDLRYSKVILLTDADVDGAHIRSLLLTFLFRYSRELFERGHVYVGCPPLYKVEAGSKAVYCFDDKEREEAEMSFAGRNFTVQRFKGLGEMMPQQLWDTTMDPDKRTLKRLSILDGAEASHVFSVLMGNKVEPRKLLIEEHSQEISLTDLDI
mmetsp:Transcript_17144/g.47848  ORF Transcript_17144/g.47848 Transcript_17144/m.47848 type:complete len:786 (+) Transcript_17144:95-2452(+)